MKAGTFVAAALPFALVVSACGEEVISVPSPPSGAKYQVSFASTRVAVAADAIQVLVFDATNGPQASTDCLSLITKQKSAADLPKAPLLLAQTDVVPLCDILADTEGKKGQLPQVSYGKRSFLAVVKRANADFFLGCAEATLTSSDTTVDIPVTQVDETVQIPTTTCATLGDKCKNTGCK